MAMRRLALNAAVRAGGAGRAALARRARHAAGAHRCSLSTAAASAAACFPLPSRRQQPRPATAVRCRGTRALFRGYADDVAPRPDLGEEERVLVACVSEPGLGGGNDGDQELGGRDAVLVKRAAEDDRSDELLVTGIIEAVHARIRDTLLGSSPPPDILAQLALRVDGVLTLATAVTAGTRAVAAKPPRAVMASHILVDDEDYCRDVKAMAEETGGEAFASLARRHSRCGSGLSTGGSLGEIHRDGGQLDADFEAAAFAAPPGVVTGPVRTAHGYHLILTEHHLEVAAATSAQSLNIRVEVVVPSSKFNPLVHACVVQATNAPCLVNNLLGLSGNSGRAVDSPLFEQVQVTVTSPFGIWRLDVGPPPSQFS